MPVHDLRQFLARLEEEQELITVADEVNWDQEVGALMRVGIDQRGPAMLMERIKDYPDFRIAANVLGPSRPALQSKLALALDCPKDTQSDALIDIYRERYRNLVKPRLVPKAPCKENILKGEQVDLTALPVPLIHDGDGGRYLGTWSVTVTKDPDSGWVNWGTYRHMLHSPRTIGWLAHPGQHGPWQYYQKYEARNQPMPIAIAIGCEPVCHMMAASQVPPGTSEAEVAGALRREPVELVRCETVDLEVPASAEIVLEGYVLPGERQLEGDFGEFTGYYAGGRLPRPVVHIECVTFRNKPIFTVSNPGKPWDEYHIVSSVTMSAMLLDDLRSRGIPARAAYVPGPATAILVSVKPQYVGYIHTVYSAVFSTKAGLYRPYLFVFDEDVDITDTEEVFWALITRLHPARGIHVFENAPCIPLMPFLSAKEREMRCGARVAFDLTIPPEWSAEDRPKINDFEHAYSKEAQEAALRIWNRATKGAAASSSPR